MSHSYLLAIDQGTTGTTVLVLDVHKPENPRIIGRYTEEFPQHFPKSGWVEHHLDQIWESLRVATTNACNQAQTSDPGFSLLRIAAIGITNQRETICTFDRKSTKPLIPAIVWQDKRSQEICQRLKEHEPRLRQKTGLVFDPYFSGTKINWILENSAEVAREVAAKRALFGTIDTYLLFKLTAGQCYGTEPSNASRTQLFDLNRGEFDGELMELLGLPHRDCLPQVFNSADRFGKTKGVGFLPDGIPITGVLGDQQAALAGQTCFQAGEAKCTYGTGAFMLLNIGQSLQFSQAGLLTTVAWSLNDRLTFALEGSAFIAGAAIQYVRDQLQMLRLASESEALAQGHVASPEVYFVPALSGLGAPYWDASAKGAILGMTRGTSKQQIIRAALEGIGFAVNDLYESMLIDCPSERRILRVDGGASLNNILMQFQADLSQVTVDRPLIAETTAFGAAMFAGLGVGMYRSLDDLKHMRAVDQEFAPDQSSSALRLREQRLKGWKRAVKAVQVFAADSQSSD